MVSSQQKITPRDRRCSQPIDIHGWSIVVIKILVVSRRKVIQSKFQKNFLCFRRETSIDFSLLKCTIYCTAK